MMNLLRALLLATSFLLASAPFLHFTIEATAAAEEKPGGTSITSGPLRFEERLIHDKYGYAYGIAAIDLDCDGDLDLTSADATRDVLHWFENDGKGNFKKHRICEKEPRLLERHAAGDIDRDGWPDVVIVKNLAHQVLWFKNTGRPRDGKPWKKRDFSITGEWIAARSEGDAAFSWSACTRGLVVRGGCPAPCSPFASPLPYSCYGYSLSNWVTRDAKVSKKHVITENLPRAYDVALADLDGDGDLDVAASCYQGNEFAWFVHDGKPGDGKPWIKHVIDSNIGDTRTIAVADFNGDGRPDILGSGLTGNLIAWYEASGKPEKLAWKKHKVDDKSFSPCHGHPVAMDGDGDMDIVMALGYAAGGSVNTHQAAWYENVGKPGKGQTWKRHVIGSHFAAFEAIAVDLDGDKDLDVVATAMGVAGVVWFENSGNPSGKWKRHVIKTPWTNANQVIAADFNGDGRPDLAASAERGANEVRMWLNLGKAK